MLLSRVLFRTQYSPTHYVAVATAILGLGLLVTADVATDRNTAINALANNRVAGDLLTLLAAAMYAISNVGQEYMVKHFDRCKYLFGIGLFGSVLSFVQAVALERAAVQRIAWSGPIVAYSFGFTTCMVVIYSAIPVLLAHSSATALNLSFLTSDFFSVVFAVFLFSARLHALYFFAFAIVLSALVMYHLADAGHSMADVCALVRRSPAFDFAHGRAPAPHAPVAGPGLPDQP